MQKNKYGNKGKRDDTATSSDSSSSEGNDSDDSEHARFKVVAEDEKFKWTFPKIMANYANKYFEGFILRDTWKKPF